MPAPLSHWLPDVIRAFRACGGKARLPEAYDWIRRNREDLPDEWEASIRSTIYNHSSDSPVFRPGTPDVFRKVDRGVWALRRPEQTVMARTVVEDMIFRALLRNDPMARAAYSAFLRDESLEKVVAILEGCGDQR